MYFRDSPFAGDLSHDIQNAVALTVADWPKKDEVTIKNHLRNDVSEACGLILAYVQAAGVQPEQMARVPIPPKIASRVRLILRKFPDTIHKLMGCPQAPYVLVN